jgi:uncharacterized protein (UPF0179 family)
MVITLLPKSVADVGYEFTHLGKTQICKKCSLLKVCVDALKEDYTYKITSVRKKEHECLIDNQVMVVCEVEETNDTISVTRQKFLENIIVNRDSLDCQEILCKYHENCMSPLYDNKTKVKVVSVIEDIQCPLKYELVLVEVKKLHS